MRIEHCRFSRYYLKHKRL